MKTAVVVGAGPAGLMAAEMLAEAGLSVTIAEAKPSPARKFLMAGKSGLNLTKAEPDDHFLNQIHGPERLREIVENFGPTAVQSWAKSLGQDVFTGTSGRVFPTKMKASPLLRAWLARLNARGVTLKRNWRWVGQDGPLSLFDTPEGDVALDPDVVVLALGGASWSRLGADGKWADILAKNGVDITPFKPSNMGFNVPWSAHMEKHFGRPVKPVALLVGDQRVEGEFVVSRTGIEGSAIYAVSRALRENEPMKIDLVPGRNLQDVAERIARKRAKTTLTNHLRKSLSLDPVKLALLQEFARPLPQDAEALAKIVKSLPITHEGPRPIDEAISTAGGLPFAALNDDLMIKKMPGVFACGEMLDWDAPTGGYLLTTCFATGRHAGQAAAAWALAQT